MKPTDDMLILAMLLARGAWDDGDHVHSPVWADEVRGVLQRLGFQCTSQQVGAWLHRLSHARAIGQPPVVERLERVGAARYRVTRAGANQLRSRFPLAAGILKA